MQTPRRLRSRAPLRSLVTLYLEAIKAPYTFFNGASIPPATYAVGIGMSGNATFVLNAGPNMRHALPKPAYYIAAINEVEHSEEWT